MSRARAIQTVAKTLGGMGYIREPRGWALFIKPLSDQCFLRQSYAKDGGPVTFSYTHPTITRIVRNHSDPAPQALRALEAELDPRFEDAVYSVKTWRSTDVLNAFGWATCETSELLSTEDADLLCRSATDLDRECSKGDWSEHGIALRIEAEELGGVPTHTLALRASRGDWIAFDRFLEQLLESFAIRFPGPDPRGAVAYAKALHEVYAARLRKTFAEATGS
jgi:hypothetical protein